MKKIIIFLSIIFIQILNAAQIERSDINPNKFVIMLGSYVGINDAQRFASKFNNEDIYILKDKNLYTVRIVNIPTKAQALTKIKNLKKTVPDAILWKKMDYINKKKFNKLHSRIFMVQTDVESPLKELSFSQY